MEMMPKSMDSLDVVQMVMLVEEIFGTEIPDNDAEGFHQTGTTVSIAGRHFIRDRRGKNGAK